MSEGTLNQEYNDVLNVRLSIALNTGAPFCFFGFALGDQPVTLETAILSSVAGLVLYSLVEYSVHRWVLHGLDVIEHRNHHQNPAAPHAMLFSTGLAVHSLFLVLLTWIAGSVIAIWTVFGSALGYALFVQLHEFEHSDSVLSFRLWPNLHRHHMLHHDRSGSCSARSDSQCNYGVVTTFWDRVFRTYCA